MNPLNNSSLGTALTYAQTVPYQLPPDTPVRAEVLTQTLQVSIRAFLPVWVFLYVIQFLLMPVIARDYWLSLFLGNSLYLAAFGYYFVITFLGYNGETTPLFSPTHRSHKIPELIMACLALPFLHHTHLLLSPIAVLIILWVVSLFGLNLPKHFAPVLWAGADLRKAV